MTGDGRILAREPEWRVLPAVEIARGQIRAKGIRKTRLVGPRDKGRTALRHTG